MNNTSRYIVGIDLGTTNSALAYVDTAAPTGERRVQLLPIPQLTAPGEVSELPCLPSFVYLPEARAVAPGMLRLPWHTDDASADYAVGAWARDQASLNPGQVVASAKSWLCYEGLDRRSDCLPWNREGGGRQLSPVRASQLYLEHLRDAWNFLIAGDDPDTRLENQQLTLTVPASFDAVARELTVEAATAAGLTFQLLEEPQAAFYAWLHEQGETWRKVVGDGDVILVCDVGGGTSDFSLIAVTDQDGELGLQRLAVGDHTLLGGDNMDLTLAYGVAARLRNEQGITLDQHQLAALTHACRKAKEAIGAGAEGPQALTILGRGSGVVSGTLTAELSAEDIRAFLLDGFFPQCDIGAQPAARRKAGLRTFGLEYAADPALTRHLAAFIERHSFKDAAGRPMLPTAVLFNGGVSKAAAFQQRVIAALQQWNQAAPGPVLVLPQNEPDLAVAIGAAWQAHVQREGGLRIRAGSARSYYIGIESSLPAVPGFPPPLEALCVVNFGLEEGSAVDIEAEGLGLMVGEPTEFRLFSSTCRQEDAIGTRLSQWDDGDLSELPPMVVELPLEEDAGAGAGTLVPVTLRTVLTDIGTFQLWCDDRREERSWKLEFELRRDGENAE